MPYRVSETLPTFTVKEHASFCPAVDAERILLLPPASVEFQQQFSISSSKTAGILRLAYG